MSGADEWNRAMDAIERADAKRARKAALREDHRRWTAEGRDWARYDLEHLTHDRPHGLWDREERFWRCNPPHDCAGFTPRWRARLNHRRSLPWVWPPCPECMRPLRFSRHPLCVSCWWETHQ